MGDLILKPSSGSGNKVRIQDQTGADNLIIDADASMTGVKPHIIPNKLYPAVAGKLLDGSTSHSGDYGTAQSDGRSYYYTDIKGSREISDPRIGAYFGSQRHKFKSLQLLEQETATHGKPVYSVDGREWLKAVNKSTLGYASSGIYPYALGDGIGFYEIVGYFSDANWISNTKTSARGFVTAIDGGSDSSENTSFETSVNTPLGGRYVDSGSIVNLDLPSTHSISLGIHTLKVKENAAADEPQDYGIELIAQDIQNFTATNATNTLTTTGHTLTNGDQIRLTGSDLPNGLNATTTYYVISVSGNNFQVSTSSGGSAVTFSDDGSGTRTWTALNNVIIPAQTVISYGKKFTIDAQSTHYDPFHGFTNDTTLFSSRVDVATSLGLGTATTWGAAWDKGSDNHIRPYNGGRVVKWIDSSGNIKTSVTMMPANAQNIGTTASNEITTPSATNSQTINFSDDAVENSLSEVAKQYLWSEFGNGSAESADGGSWKDWSMNNASSHERAYVMDDGSTSLLTDHAVFGTDAENDGLGCRIAVDTGVQNTYFTFIGTGISAELKEWDSGAKFDEVGFQHLAQNLPYGTHVIKIARDNTGTDEVTLLVDGVSAQVEAFNVDHNALETLRFMAFHQPKMPPVPPEACIIMDTMLMADYVATSTGAVPNISKGVRRISSSRDILYDASSGTPALAIDIQKNMGFQMTAGGTPSADVFQANLPAFATIMEANGFADRRQIYVDGGSAEGQTVVGSSYGACTKMNSAKPLGIHTFTSKNKASTDGDLDAIDVAIPTHSPHYYEFENSFLKELVGGDRNMEQHNLIVTPDGKSWDELTRDTSYLTNVKMRTNLGNEQSITNPLIWTEWRGKASAGDIDGIYKFNKDFAINVYGKGVTCLVPGNYQITWWVYINMDDAAGGYTIYVNGTIITQNYSATPASGKTNSLTIIASPYLYRGDYITMGGTSAISQQNFEIIRV